MQSLLTFQPDHSVGAGEIHTSPEWYLQRGLKSGLALISRDHTLFTLAKLF